eukprot:235361_1
MCIPITEGSVIDILVIVILGTVSLSILLHGIKQSIVHQNLFQLLRIFIILYYIITILWCLQIIIHFMSVIFLISNIMCLRIQVISLFGTGCYFVGLPMLYLTFVLRLKYSFIDTNFEITNCKYYFFLSALALWFVLYGFVIIYVSVTKDLNGSGIAKTHYLFATSYLVYSLLLLMQYLRNITRAYSHNIHTTQSKKPSQSDSDKSSNTLNMSTTADIDTENRKTSDTNIQLMVKYLLCYSIAFISTVILTMLRLVTKFSAMHLSLNITLIMIDSLINVIALTLQLIHGHTIYMRWCYYVRKPLESYMLSKLSNKQKKIRSG